VAKEKRIHRRDKKGEINKLDGSTGGRRFTKPQKKESVGQSVNEVHGDFDGQGYCAHQKPA